MTSTALLLAGLVGAVFVLRWSNTGVGSSSRLSIAAVLGIAAAVFNVIVPVPSIEVTTTLVVCCSIALGWRMGVSVGAVAVLGASVAGGVGVWTLWQIIAVSFAAGIAVCFGPLVRLRAPVSNRRVALWLSMATMLSTVTWDLVVTVGSIVSIGTQEGVVFGQQLGYALWLGGMFTLIHTVFSVGFSWIVGPGLVHTLQRARPRLDGGVVVSRPSLSRPHP